MKYKHLNYIKRCQVYAFWKAGYTKTKIAEEVGVHKSTISRELRKNITFVRTSLGFWQYKPDYAQAYTEERLKKKRKHIKFTKKVEDFVHEKLLQEWSPEQIVNRQVNWCATRSCRKELFPTQRGNHPYHRMMLGS